MSLGPEHCPEPVHRAVMRQQWRDLVYVHWRYDPDLVQSLLPRGLTVDTFDGSAWVGLIPFSMRDIGAARGPGVPYLGTFSEVNVRTYVRCGDRRGVWFFSLDVDRLVPALVARLSYRLPYCWGATSHVRDGERLTTVVERRWPRRVETARLEVERAEPVTSDDLDVFLTARWGLFSPTRRGVRYAAVDHAPWPLRQARLVEVAADGLVEAAGLPRPRGEAHVRCSDGVAVRIGRPHRMRLASSGSARAG